MSDFEVGREIEKFNQRILALENIIGNDSDCACDCYEDDFDINESQNSIRVHSIRVSKNYCMKIISVKHGAEIENSINLNGNFYTTIEGGIRFVVLFHMLNSGFDFSSVFKNSFRGLGSGRCGCWKWSGYRCKPTRYDDDCCDKTAYFNRCDDHCDETCSGWDAKWEETPDKC